MRLDRIAEERIRQSLRAGEFDELSGAGKPIEWRQDNPHVGEWQLAFDMLDNAGMSPGWIELEKSIRDQVQLTREALSQAWRQWGKDSPAWALATVRFTEAMARINRAIRLRNLLAPSGARSMALVNAARELAQVAQPPTDP